MNIEQDEMRVPGTGEDSVKHIGITKVEWVAINPTAAARKKLYNTEADLKETDYTGKDKKDKKWAMLKFMFQDMMSKEFHDYSIFVNKEIAEFDTEKDGEKLHKTWYVNQHGVTQCVVDEKDLWDSFTTLQMWDKDAKAFKTVEANGSPVKLKYRKAFGGETALYSLLRKLIKIDWFKATQKTNIFMDLDLLMTNNTKELEALVGGDNVQPIVGMLEIKSKSSDTGGTMYNQNFVDGAWMIGEKYAEANMLCIQNGWEKYDEKANGKGKQKELYEFYQAVKRNKNTTCFTSVKVFNPEKHLSTSTGDIQHSEEGEEIVTSSVGTDWDS